MRGVAGRVYHMDGWRGGELQEGCITLIGGDEGSCRKGLSHGWVGG